MLSLPWSPWRPALLGVALAALTAGCDNDCNFWERCNGNVVEICGEMPDQTSNRRVSRSPCEEPNGVCVESGRSAICVATAKVACDTSAAPRCQDGAVVTCSSAGYESIEECDPAFAVCHENDSQTAACVFAPGLTCSDAYRPHCQDALLVSCSNQHLVIAQDCTREPGHPTCFDNGTSAYCK